MAQIQTLSLWQPWATLLAHGKKKIETRSWPVPFNVPMPTILAIHATKTMSYDILDLCEEEPFASLIRECGYATAASLPRGAIVGLGVLQRCYRIVDGSDLTTQERALGDFRPGRFGWVFGRVLAFDKPVPQQGARQIWNWDCPDDFEEVAELLLSPAPAPSQLIHTEG